MFDTQLMSMVYECMTSSIYSGFASIEDGAVRDNDLAKIEALGGHGVELTLQIYTFLLVHNNTQPVEVCGNSRIKHGEV